MAEKCNTRDLCRQGRARSPPTLMRTTLITAEPHIVHAIPGRLRIHIPGWSNEQQPGIESQLLLIPGVSSVQANPLTGNVLIRFDSALTTESILRAATAGILAHRATIREHDTIAQPQPWNDFPLPVSHAPTARISPQPPITPRTSVRPARAPVADIALLPATTAQPVPMQPLVRLNPSHAHPLNTTPPEWLREHEVAQEVARSQVLRTTGKTVAVRYPHDALANSRPAIHRAERHAAAMSPSEPVLPETTTIHAWHSSILRRILRALLAPGVAAFVLKTTSVILGLARASSPLGLVLGGIEIVQLFAEAHERWLAFTPASGSGVARVCMQCQAAF
jgi:cation-transporting P-type ATPase I